MTIADKIVRQIQKAEAMKAELKPLNQVINNQFNMDEHTDNQLRLRRVVQKQHVENVYDEIRALFALYVEIDLDEL